MYGNFRKKYLKKQMIEIYQSKKSQDHTKLFIEFIESRLDAVLYKSKFATSIRNAKQLITHKNIKVNNKIEKNGSYILKQGDLISVTSKSKSILKQNLKKQIYDRPDAVLPIPPSYLNINYKTLEIIFNDITNFKFTTSFNLKLDTNSIVKNYYRH
jgi:small subunit ribosomal protein S4